MVSKNTHLYRDTWKIAQKALPNASKIQMRPKNPQAAAGAFTYKHYQKKKLKNLNYYSQYS